MTKTIKLKCTDQHDVKCEAKNRRTDVNGQESGGKSSQAETNDQKRQIEKTSNEKQHVKNDRSSDCGGKVNTSCDLLLEYYFKFGDVIIR